MLWFLIHSPRANNVVLTTSAFTPWRSGTNSPELVIVGYSLQVLRKMRLKMAVIFLGRNGLWRVWCSHGCPTRWRYWYASKKLSSVNLTLKSRSYSAEFICDACHSVLSPYVSKRQKESTKTFLLTLSNGLSLWTHRVKICSSSLESGKGLMPES